jgi:hypothetical protein
MTGCIEQLCHETLNAAMLPEAIVVLLAKGYFLLLNGIIIELLNADHVYSK